MLHEDSPLFAEAEARGYLLTAGLRARQRDAAGRPRPTARDSATSTSPTRPAGRWWWAAHRDLREPRHRRLVARRRRGPAGERRLHGGDGTLLHNIYDRLRHQAFAEGEAADRPDQRVFLLCRSGAAGMQRFGATCWSGDINNDFPTLEAQVPLGLNTGLSGVPYWGTDIGGFFHPVPETGELYARWFQLGAFSPIFRSHGWVWREHVPWAHGPEVEAICRRYAELRYQLLPYTYTLAWQAHTLGLPLMRPLVLNYPDDPRVWTARPRVPVGRRPAGRAGHPRGRDRVAGLSARGPLVRLLDRRLATRGPGRSRSPAPLDRLPLLVRAGAIIPMGPIVQHTGERPLDEVTLLIYPEGRLTLRDVRGRRALERLSPGSPRGDGRSSAPPSRAGSWCGSPRRPATGRSSPRAGATCSRLRDRPADRGEPWTATGSFRAQPGPTAGGAGLVGRRPRGSPSSASPPSPPPR